MKIISVLFAACCFLLSCAPVSAEFSERLIDRYLQTEFSWGMFFKLQNAEHYLNYEGSSLRPLTRISVYFRSFPQGADRFLPTKNPSKVYEDFFYHKGKLLGSRYRTKLELPTERSGAIVVGNTKLTPTEAQAITNAIVRVILDLHFRKIFADVVIVPSQQYDLITSNLSSYRFFRSESQPESGKQMSIHFRSYPDDRDDVYYLH